MPRARPFEFVKALRDLGVGLVSTDPDSNLAERPNRLLRKLSHAGLVVERTKPTPQDLTKFGFQPKTVFDVGVDSGTPFIYRAFPDAHFVLIDPLTESEDRVARWKKHIDFEFHCCAVGDQSGETELLLPSNSVKTRFSRSTTQKYSEAYSKKFETLEKRSVPVKRLDDFIHGKVAPFGIKIDTEGAELSVVQGATEALAKAEFVIAEVSVRERFAGGYFFSDFVAEMGKHGFEPLEFLTPLTPDVTDCDVLYVKRDGPHFQFK